MSESTNDALKLIARTMDILRDWENLNTQAIGDCLSLLQEAVDKLAM